MSIIPDELMITDTVNYMFGNKVCTGEIVGIKIITEIVHGDRTGVFTDTYYTVKDVDTGMIRSDYKEQNFREATNRLEAKRKEGKA